MTKKLSLSLFALLALALFLALPRTAAAQDQDSDQVQNQIQNQDQNQPDPPSRVARLNYMQGSVSFQPAGEDDWIQADPNRPLTTGDNIWADQNSRGELHIGATSIRLSSNTGISFLNLDDRTVQLQLAQGTIEIHLRDLEPGNAFEVDTPNLAFTLTSSGEYRIETDPNGDSTIIVVREGEGQVTGGGQNYDLSAGQQYVFSGTDQLAYDAQPAPGFDDFENWAQSRDQFENNSQSAKYVSRDIDGYYDLDQYGQWRNDPDNGPMWIPSGVAVGWTPYHYGHWVWVNPWGWTWIEDEPWGFAPFHYGRWAYVGGYWGWVPGPRVVRPVYAPAVVGFVGGGGGFSVGIGFGGGFAGVAWFPLGPRDVYIPGYRSSARYVQYVNVTNSRVVNVTQVTSVYNTRFANQSEEVNRMHYTYANNAAAVTAVSRETFVNARPVAGASVRVSTEQLQTARVTEVKPFAPTRSSYVSATAKVSYAKPKVAFSQRQVVARLNPPPPVANHAAPRVVNAQTPPRGAAAPARGGIPPARSENLAQPDARVNNQPTRENPSAPRPNVYTNENIPRSQPATTEKQQENPAYQQPRPNERAQEAAPQTQRPPVRYAPPPQAKEENYDVHPPLNHNAAAPQERKQEPPPKSESKPQPKESKSKDSKPK